MEENVLHLDREIRAVFHLGLSILSKTSYLGRGSKKEANFTKKEIKKIVGKKEELLKKTRHLLDAVPEGTLKFQSRDGVTYYYWQRKNSETKKWVEPVILGVNAKLL